MNPRVGQALGLLGNLFFLFLAVLFFILRHQEEKQRFAAERLADQLAGELADVNEQWEVAKLQVRETQSELQKLRQEKEAIALQLKDREDALQKMRIEFARLRSELPPIHLGRVVVQGENGPSRSDAGADAASRVEGRVLALNQKFNFVIVDLGTRDGIKEGMDLRLYQDGVDSGRLRVDMADETLSAAAVIEHEGREIRPGDRVMKS